MKRFLAFITVIIVIFSTQTIYAEQEEDELARLEKEAVLSALYEADISFVKEAVQLGLVTCRELTEYYLERIEKYNEEYNCFITICNDAMEKAVQRDKQLADGASDGALFGIPVVIKDNMNMEGYPTTNGHSISSSAIAADNAEVVDYLLEEGAVIIGKTNMSTDAQDARASESIAVGETKNAYNSTLASGGSSGGTAVAVSLNFACAGLGTDTNSSLRLPAALNGCVSLRTTHGLVSTEGVIPLNDTRDVAGAITRDVYDQAVMLDVLTGGVHGFEQNLKDDALEGKRIGILSELTYSVESSSLRTEKNIDDEVCAAFDDAVKELKSCGAEVTDVSMPKLFALADRSLEDDSSWLKEALYEEFEAMVEDNDLDAVIFPSYLSSPLRSGPDENGKHWETSAQVFINNTAELSSSARLPEISVPIGNHSLGAGIGMEIAALKGEEQLLLDIAYSYTEKYDHRQTPEGAPDIYKGTGRFSLQEVLQTSAVTASAVGGIAGDSVSVDGQYPRWIHVRNVLIICGISAVLVIIAAYSVIIKGNKRRKIRKKTRL